MSAPITVKGGTLGRLSVQHNQPVHFSQARSNSHLGYVSVADRAARPSPEHVPDPIAAAFNEGAKCLAINCFNAAAAMFRLALDLATQELLPSDDAEFPNARTRRMLGLRLAACRTWARQSRVEATWHLFERRPVSLCSEGRVDRYGGCFLAIGR